MTTATPSLTLVITVPSLSCRSSKASCSPFESFEYFDGLICAVLIFFFFNVLIVWCFFCLFFFGGGRGIYVLSVTFLNISSSLSGLFVWSLKCALSLILLFFLSCFALLILEKICDRLFPCFRCLLVGLIDRSLSDVFGLVTLSKLVVKFCLVEGYQVLPNISAYIGCVFSFFESCCFYLHFGFIFQVAKLFDFSLI